MEVKLRQLELKDAVLMLEWMHDKDIVRDLQADFLHKTIDDCNNFIKNARTDENNLHLAIVNADDEYMGTVSLKNIRECEAEFGITIRKKAMGKGISIYAMKEIIKIGFNEKKLKRIYWCVSPKNTRAVRFYDKNNFKRYSIGDRKIEGYTVKQIKDYIWYEIKG